MHKALQQRKRRHKYGRRMTILLVVIFLFAVVIAIRLFDLQILNHDFFRDLAADRHGLYQKIVPARGEIFMADTRDAANGELYPLAMNYVSYQVYAVPQEIEDAEMTLNRLDEILKCTSEEKEILASRLSKGQDPYEPIKSKLDEETAWQIKNLKLPGIDIAQEFRRYYPQKNIGSHLAGFYGHDHDKMAGRYGLEESFEEELRGEMGAISFERDIAGRLIPVGQRKVEDAQDGLSLVLTIDQTIQFTVCEKLREAIVKHGASGGTVVVINPQTGAVLAMCSYPDFDPNNYEENKDISVFNNPATFYQYEPGSIFKPITMAAALDLGLVEPQTTYVDRGFVKVGVETIKNSDNKSHGEQTMTQVLEASLNTGAVFAAQKTGREQFFDYVKKFGFGSPLGIELKNESGGDISRLQEKREIYLATASFGQGISVTPLQLAAAYGAIANQGKLMKPHLVDRIVDSAGKTLEKTEPQMLRQVISPSASALLSGMLVSVVENGHGQRAGVPGYFIAGKTGTAQVPKKDGKGYDPSQSIGSFAGFGTVENPKFVMVVKIDNPKSVIWAESTAAPLFGEIAAFILDYYQVEPER